MSMGDRSDTARSTGRYVSLVLFALAFGWIEGAVVVYLRELFFQQSGAETSLFPAVFLTDWLARVEIVREAATLVLLATIAWVADHRWAARIGAFLLVFGVWDLMYYAMLKLVLGWPVSLATWDILFLIPVPWIAPVWAPALVAALFVVIGTWLLRTASRFRAYSMIDAAVLLVSATIVVASFMADWRVVVDQQVPDRFHVWLYSVGVVAGLAWFVLVERRVAAADRAGADAGGSL